MKNVGRFKGFYNKISTEKICILVIAEYPAYPLCQQTSRKLEIFMTQFLTGIHDRAIDIPFHEHVDAFVGIGAERLLHLSWPEGQHVSNTI